MLHRTLVTLLLVALGGLPAQAATFYVATTGSDSAAGTMAAPFATVGRAQTAAAAGDTVFIRGGTYAFSGTGTGGVTFSKSGTAALPINYFAFASEIPIFDLTNLTPSDRVTGLDVHCDWIHIRGLEVKGVHQFAAMQDSWGVRIRGNNNVIENLNVHHNDAPGIFISSGATNVILNCDSHHNWDYLEGGGSGDGFGCHSPDGGNLLSGCRAYDNSDDGFDFINAKGSCTVEKSLSFRNGWEPGTTNPAGNGGGFKAGGYGSPPSVADGTAATHTVRQCVAFGNRAEGFYANHHNGRINFLNNTAFRNPTNFEMRADAGHPSDHVLRNNIVLAPGIALADLTGGTASFNSWDLAVTVSTADFLSVTETEALAPRQSDGGLPNVNFLRLTAGSDLIDRGTNVGLPFAGTAPDLGAFEFGAPIGGASGTGGASGAGGASGTGGASGAGGARGTGTGGDSGTGGHVSTGGTTSPGSGGDGMVIATGGISGTGGATSPGSGGAVTPSETGGAGGTTSTGGARLVVSTGTGSCACATSHGTSSAGPLLWLFAVSLLSVRRKRCR